MEIAQYLDFYVMSLGSIVYCIRDIEDQIKALQLENAKVDEQLEATQEAAAEASAVRFKWNVQQQKVSSGRGRAMETDGAIDKTLTAMNEALGALSRNAARPIRQKQAQELKRAFFSNGVRPISGLNFEDQLLALRGLLERAENEFEAHIENCRLEIFLEQLGDLVEQFASDLDIRKSDEVTWDQVEATEGRTREEFARLLFALIGDYYNEPETLSTLLEQFLDQQDRIASHLKRRGGSTPDVDPDTGEILEPGSDGGNTDPVSPAPVDNDPITPAPADDPTT